LAARSVDLENMCDMDHRRDTPPPLTTVRVNHYCQPPHPHCRPVGLCGHTTRQGDNRDMMRHNLKLGRHNPRRQDNNCIMGNLKGTDVRMSCLLNGMCFSNSITFLNTNHFYSIRAFGSLCRSDGTFYHWQWAVKTESAGLCSFSVGDYRS
jgi:hypothetical protein